MTREDIYNALFDLISNSCNGLGVKTFSRNLKDFLDVDASIQPAIFQVQVAENSKQVLKIPAIWTLEAEIWIYINTSNDPKKPRSSLLNPILDALEAAMPPNEPNGPQTLGGLVSHCWFNNISTHEGFLGEQLVSIGHIEIKGAE
jgi:hypothetical protein